MNDSAEDSFIENGDIDKFPINKKLKNKHPMIQPENNPASESLLQSLKPSFSQLSIEEEEKIMSFIGNYPLRNFNYSYRNQKRAV